jgi:hypothetical protein
MEINELNKLKSHFYILEKDRNVYCSRCGEKLLKDTYQYSRHEEKCKIQFINKYNINKDEQVFGFSFRIIDDYLVFNVYKLTLELRPGFKDRYQGSKWKSIFIARFTKESKKVEEKGLYNIDIWFKKMIDQDGIICLNKYDYINVINQFFASLHEIYNLGMFLDLYRQKGYHSVEININELKKTDMETEFDDMMFLNECIEDYSYKIGKKVCICNAIEINNNVVLQCLIYDYMSLTRIKSFYPENVIYLSKDFVDFREKVDYEYLFKDMYFKYNNLWLFTKKYPELMVDNYIKNGGKNIFKIILGSNYNKCIELTAKSGLAYFSDNFNLIQDIINPYGNNINEIFNLPFKIVKSLNSYDGLEYLVKERSKEALISAFEIYTVMFEKNIKLAQLILLEDYYNKNKHENRCFNDFTKKDLLKVFRYIGENNFNDRPYAYAYYKDYLDMCKRYGRYIYGFCPQDVFQAHDMILDLIRIDENRILIEQFNIAVNNEEYKKLASSYIKEGNKKPDIESEVFEIILPKEHTDLIKESTALHHCVRTYIEKVSLGKTYILFLRKKDEIDKPYATIEVLPNNTLIQLKAYCNSKAEKSAQNYVKKWAKAKGIKIDSYDLSDNE